MSIPLSVIVAIWYYETPTSPTSHQPTENPPIAMLKPAPSSPDSPCSYSSHLGRTRPSCKCPKQPRLLHGITTRPVSPRIDLVLVAFRRLHGATVERNERRNRWPRLELGKSSLEDRRIRENCSRRKIHVSLMISCTPAPRSPQHSPLAILDTSKHNRIPKRVQLAPPSIHDITQILINLLGRQSRMSIGSRLSSFLGTDNAGRDEVSPATNAG